MTPTSSLKSLITLAAFLNSPSFVKAQASLADKTAHLALPKASAKARSKAQWKTERKGWK